MMRPMTEPRPQMNPRKPSESADMFDTFEPKVNLSDVILPPDTLEAVEDTLYFIENRENVFKKTGLCRTLEKGKGPSLLFYGHPGTGKTMTAEAFASALGKKVSIVRPDAVESSFFGATEKNIARLFDIASSGDTVVVFDECDSFFTARPVGETYQNELVSRQVNMFLRGLEETEGVFILTSNREKVLDPALERRLSATVYFGLPDEEGRAKLWRKLLPSKHNLSKKDLSYLSSQFPVSGGIIKQAVLTAVRRVARAGTLITLDDLVSALDGCSRETKSIGF
jgi:SpoVK/Ycf46/Vps4 family AAA+-type ATPase